MFELSPVDFAIDVAAKHTTHTIVKDTIFDEEVADSATHQRSQENLGEGFGAFGTGDRSNSLALIR